MTRTYLFRNKTYPLSRATTGSWYIGPITSRDTASAIYYDLRALLVERRAGAVSLQERPGNEFYVVVTPREDRWP